jgi:hypothetical protein
MPSPPVGVRHPEAIAKPKAVAGRARRDSGGDARLPRPRAPRPPGSPAAPPPTSPCAEAPAPRAVPGSVATGTHRARPRRDHQLGDAHPALDPHGRVAEVDEDHPDLAAVVGVDGPGRVRHGEALLEREPTAGAHLGLEPLGNRDLEPRRHEGPRPRRDLDRRCDRREQVHARRTLGGVARQRQLARVREYLDLDVDALGHRGRSCTTGSGSSVASCTPGSGTTVASLPEPFRDGSLRLATIVAERTVQLPQVPPVPHPPGAPCPPHDTPNPVGVGDFWCAPLDSVSNDAPSKLPARLRRVRWSARLTFPARAGAARSDSRTSRRRMDRTVGHSPIDLRHFRDLGPFPGYRSLRLLVPPPLPVGSRSLAGDSPP